MSSATHTNARYVVDIGGVDNMHYTANHSHFWNFADIADAVDCKNAFFVGAGASSKHVTGDNCELMPNTHVHHRCATKSSEVDPSSGRCVLVSTCLIWSIELIRHFWAQ